MKVYDGKGCIMGRLGAAAAKETLKGEEVNIYNAENIIITGNKENIFGDYKRRWNFRDLAYPEHGPKLPRRPDLFVKKVLRGMFPIKSSRGKLAYKRMKIFMGEPEGKAEKIFELKKDIKFVTIGELCKFLGWKG